LTNLKERRGIVQKKCNSFDKSEKYTKKTYKEKQNHTE